MKNITNVTIDKNSSRASVTRNGVTNTRRFLHTKFGGKKVATESAYKYAMWLKHEATDQQFETAYRPPGRPMKSEFFGRRIVNN